MRHACLAANSVVFFPACQCRRQRTFVISAAPVETAPQCLQCVPCALGASLKLLKVGTDNGSMRTPTVSHGEVQPARIAVPVLARLPDLDPPTAAVTAEPAAEETEESQMTSRQSNERRRSRKKPKASPAAKEQPGGWTKLKSQLLFTLIVLAFVLLIGTLIFHRGPSQDQHPSDAWNDVAAVEQAPDGAATESPAALPYRLPAVGNAVSEPPLTSGPQMALQGPDNRPAATATYPRQPEPGVAQLDGTIEPAARQAQQATYPSESIR